MKAPVTVDFRQAGGYFEKNDSGLKGDRSYLAFVSQQQFDKVFGAAATMDTGESDFLSDDEFKSKFVVAVIKRGARRSYNNVKVTTEKGKLYVWYDAEDRQPDGAVFSTPLIVSLDKGKYKEVVFMENGKKSGTVRVKK